jgi:Flp pilus assembly pilin Flp
MQFTEHLRNELALFLAEEFGASLTEYVLVASLAAVIVWLTVLAMEKGI